MTAAGPLPGLRVGWHITRAPVRYVASSGREMEGCAMDEVEGPQEWHISMGYTLDWLQARFERGEHSDTWTGLSTLDWLLGEPHAGLAMEVQCESAMMRTAFLLGVALEAARNGKRTLFVSGALSETETGLRVLSMLSGVDLGRMRWGRLLEGHWRLMGDALANDLPMHTWSLKAEPEEQLLSDLADVREFDVVVIDGCQVPRLARAALRANCWVATSPLRGDRHLLTDNWIRLELRPRASMGSSGPVPVDAVVVASAVCAEGSVRLAFDPCCVRFESTAVVDAGKN